MEHEEGPIRGLFLRQETLDATKRRNASARHAHTSAAGDEDLRSQAAIHAAMANPALANVSASATRIPYDGCPFTNATAHFQKPLTTTAMVTQKTACRMTI
jgi:hypothetical protein